MFLGLALFVLLIIVSYYLFNLGANEKAKAICPYCNQQVVFNKQDQVVKCDNCHHKSVVKSGQLTKL